MSSESAGSGQKRLRPADVVLHPVRMRIVQAFLGDRELTTQDLRTQIPDVPTATLYRQVATLARGGVLDVVDEKRVRGTVERTYRLRAGAAHVDADEAGQLTVDEHRQAFWTFALSLMGDYDRYLDRGDVDLARDQIGFRRQGMYLTDDETSALLEELGAVLRPRIAQPQAPGRTRRLLATVLQLDPATPRPDDERRAPPGPVAPHRRTTAGADPYALSERDGSSEHA
jgi:hypothetical protein